MDTAAALIGNTRTRAQDFHKTHGWRGWLKRVIIPGLIGFLVLSVFLLLARATWKPSTFCHENFATYNDVVNRWNLDACNASATVPAAAEGFATDYDTISKNWGLTACDVKDSDTADLTDEDLVNYVADSKMIANQEAFATDYNTIAHNWGLTACDVVDDPNADLADEDLVNYVADSKMVAAQEAFRRGGKARFDVRSQEGFATDYNTVAKNWGLTACDVVDDPTSGLEDEDLVNYNTDAKMLADRSAFKARRKAGFRCAGKGCRGKEKFATDYATVSKNWGLTGCDVVDDPNAGLEDEDLVNYNADSNLLAAREKFLAFDDEALIRQH
jgi:hypothetical protein